MTAGTVAVFLVTLRNALKTLIQINGETPVTAFLETNVCVRMGILKYSFAVTTVPVSIFGLKTLNGNRATRKTSTDLTVTPVTERII